MTTTSEMAEGKDQTLRSVWSNAAKTVSIVVTGLGLMSLAGRLQLIQWESIFSSVVDFYRALAHRGFDWLFALVRIDVPIWMYDVIVLYALVGSAIVTSKRSEITSQRKWVAQRMPEALPLHDTAHRGIGFSFGQVLIFLTWPIYLVVAYLQVIQEGWRTPNNKSGGSFRIVTTALMMFGVPIYFLFFVLLQASVFIVAAAANLLLGLA